MKWFAKLLVMLVVASLLVVPFAGTVAASEPPTQEEVKAAIEKGVAWLLDQQNLEDKGYEPGDPQYGSWGHWEKVAVTAFAVKKLEHHAIDKKYGLGLDSPFDAPYAAQLQAGLNFLFRNAFIIHIGVQPAGDPDGDGDGIGVYFETHLWSRTYSSGIALMAISESTTPDRVVDVPDSPVDGWTYEEVAQDTLDYLAWGQTDSGSGRGGWIYSEMDNASGWSDNSNTGYAVLGLQYAEAPLESREGFGLTVPTWVKDELEIWVKYIQCTVPGPDYGGSGYTSPCDWVNILKTGNLLKELEFVGVTEADTTVQDALAYLHLHWDDPTYSSPGFHGWRADKGVDDDGDGLVDEDPINWFDDDGDGLVDEDPGIPTSNYQATFTTMKGLTSLGIHEFCDPPIDWQADFETVLLAEQNPADGSWPHTYWDYGAKPILSTLWALLTLQKVVPPRDVPVDIKPQSCPNPLNVKSKGVLPVAILGTAAFDVTQVDVTTVLLEGVSPLRWDLEDVATPFEPFIGKEACDECTDEGPDGYLDLTLGFDKQEIVAALGEVEDGQCVVLRLTGNLKEEFHGMPIVGEDVVLIIKK